MKQNLIYLNRKLIHTKALHFAYIVNTLTINQKALTKKGISQKEFGIIPK